MLVVGSSFFVFGSGFWFLGQQTIQAKVNDASENTLYGNVILAIRDHDGAGPPGGADGGFVRLRTDASGNLRTTAASSGSGNATADNQSTIWYRAIGII